MDFTTLQQALAARRTSSRTINYIEGDSNEQALPFSEIYARALGLLHHFQSHGAGPGSEMILLLDRNEQFIDTFWACMLGGIIAVPLAPGTNDEHRRKFFRVLRQLKQPHLCSNEKTFSRLSDFAAANGLVPEIEKLRPASILLDRMENILLPGMIHAMQPDDIAFVQYSSGSTSEPKGVVLSHRNLLTNIAAIARGMELQTQDSALSWMPLTHDMGLIGFHLTWLVMDITHHLMPTALFVRRPSLWLLKASEKRATLLCSPNFGYKHYLKIHDPGNPLHLDLSGVRLLFNGAEPISVELCREFLAALAPTGLRATAMFPVYCLAEASLAVTFPKPGANYRTITVKRDSLGFNNAIAAAVTDDPQAVTLACVGYPIEHCEVRIAGDTGTPLPDYTVGRILIRGDNVTHGYYQNPEVTRNAIADDGWLDTGDLGFFCEDGLVITGRLKDIIFVNGLNYYPQDIEAALDKYAGIALGRAAVSSVRPRHAEADLVLAFVLYRGELADFAPLAKQARMCVNEQIGIVLDQVIPVNKIPKTTSGKIQRYLLAEAYQNGEFGEIINRLDELAAATPAALSEAQTEIESNLKEICDLVLKGKSIGMHDNIFELGTSSLALAQIYQRIESVYPGQLVVTDFFDYPTIAELAKYLELRLKSGQS